MNINSLNSQRRNLIALLPLLYAAMPPLRLLDYSYSASPSDGSSLPPCHYTQPLCPPSSQHLGLCSASLSNGTSHLCPSLQLCSLGLVLSCGCMIASSLRFSLRLALRHFASPSFRSLSGWLHCADNPAANSFSFSYVDTTLIDKMLTAYELIDDFF